MTYEDVSMEVFSKLRARHKKKAALIFNEAVFPVAEKLFEKAKDGLSDDHEKSREAMRKVFGSTEIIKTAEKRAKTLKIPLEELMEHANRLFSAMVAYAISEKKYPPKVTAR